MVNSILYFITPCDAILTDCMYISVYGIALNRYKTSAEQCHITWECIPLLCNSTLRSTCNLTI